MVKKRWLLTALLLLLIGGALAVVLYMNGARDAKEHKGARFVWKPSITSNLP